MRLVVLLGFVSCAALVPGCTTTTCSMALFCPPIEARFELGTLCTHPLGRLRFELCRGDRCESSTIVAARSLGGSGPQRWAKCATLPCECTSDGVLASHVSGVGPMRARLFTRDDASGEERVVAERSAEVIWEEYEFDGGCAGDKDCTHYALR